MPPILLTMSEPLKRAGMLLEYSQALTQAWLAALTFFMISSNRAWSHFFPVIFSIWAMQS